MEQAVAVFLVLGLLALLLGIAVVVVVAYSRERTLTRRITSLEESVRRLAVASRESRATPTEPAAAPVAPPTAIPTPIPAASRIPERAPSLIAPAARREERAPPPSRPAAPPPAAKRRVSLERALGVTGAAVLGGVVFAIAGIYLYQYSVQQGLLTPAVRVALGTAVGVACLVASELLRKRGYRITADSLAGGAVVVLFAAFWAANRLFHLWPFGVSFALMGAVAALCCTLALRHSSQVIAVLGLVGGFATPIALSSGSDRPIGLFGWTLLVNLGFLSVAHKRRWPMMGMLALVGTTIIEALWIFARMGPHTFVLGLAVLAVFALLFVGFVALQPAAERARWHASQVGALFLPFAFALYFSSASDVLAGGHFYPTALLAALLCAAACWVARAPTLTFLPLGASAGSVALALVWMQSNRIQTALAWEFAACSVLIALVLHVGRAIGRAEPSATSTEPRGRIGEREAAALLSAGGFGVALILGVANYPSIPLWPWAAGFAALAILACWQSIAARLSVVPIVSSVLTSIGFHVWADANRGLPDAISAPVFVTVLVAFIALYQVTALRFPERTSRSTAWWGAGVAALLAQATASAALGTSEFDPRWLLAVVLGLAVLASVAASGARASLLFAIAAVATLNSLWTNSTHETWGQGPVRTSVAPTAMLFVMLGTALFTLWPFVRRSIWESSRSVWRVSAAASLFAFFPLRELWNLWLPDATEAPVPALLALVVGLGWSLSRRVSPESGAAGASHAVGRVWFAAIALFWLALVLPLQLDHDWLLVGLVLAGASEVWLWTRYDHPPLKYVGSLLIAGASSLLVLQRFSGSYPVHDAVLVNWLAWSYLVPAAAAMLASIWLAKLELPRIRTAASSRSVQSVAWCGSVCGLCAAVLFFAWLNLVILNAFGTRPSFRWLSERMPARDLSMSLAWALYALALLVLGVNRRIGGLRWISLGMFVLTIAKVFLFDLGNLQGLYRVASLLGLAITLLLVSLLYQRFVFRVSAKDEPRTPAPGGSDPGPAEPEHAS
jgi:uncharacterized membrane protein